MTTTATGVAVPARVNDTDVVMSSLRSILPSTLPAVVFTSLAAVSVPAFSDRCHILIEEDGLGTYRIERSLTDTRDADGGHDIPPVRDRWSGQWVGEHMVQTAFGHTRSSSGSIGYSGNVLHLWNPGYRPTGTDVALAQLAVDHAVAIVHREQARSRAQDLRTDRAGPAIRAAHHDRQVVDYTGTGEYRYVVRPLMAWARPGVDRLEQLTHAVLAGEDLAACGAVVTVLGDPWPEPPAPTPRPRCPICTQAVAGVWAGLDYTTPASYGP